jgi:small neutral amino acid transporter SnatA (MarC family)
MMVAYRAPVIMYLMMAPLGILCVFYGFASNQNPIVRIRSLLDDIEYLVLLVIAVVSVLTSLILWLF